MTAFAAIDHHQSAKADPLEVFRARAEARAQLVAHGLHSFSREEIRTDALMAIPFVALAAVFFRRKRRQR